MNKVQILLLITLITGALAACNSGDMRRNPGKAYAMDMTYSKAVDAYTMSNNSDIFPDSMSSRKPVMGTIARGHDLPDHIVEGDTNAYKTFSTSMKFTEDEVKEGGRLFNIYCAICHGAAMDGNGPLYSSGKFAAMPANLKGGKYLHFTVGQIYAAIKFGKNAMGSYASQVDIKQRWQIIAYIKKGQSENGGDAFTMGIGGPSGGAKDSTAAKPMEPTAAQTPKTSQGGSTGATQNVKG
jgi:hypothetical protein